MNKYFNYIVIGLLLILFIQGFFKITEGISEEEVLYRIEINELNNHKINSNKLIDSLKNTNTIYENFYDSLENDNSIDSVKSNQLRINLSNYANSRR